MTHIVMYIMIKLRYASKDNDYGVFDQPCQEKNWSVGSHLERPVFIPQGWRSKAMSHDARFAL